jgi:hypothetical protein
MAFKSSKKFDISRVPPTLAESHPTSADGFSCYIANMFTVYVLYSIKHNKIYIGYTSDIANRLLSHNELATKGHTLNTAHGQLHIQKNIKPNQKH